MEDLPSIVEKLAMDLMRGPLMRALELWVPDADARQKLAAELEKQTFDCLARAVQQGAGAGAVQPGLPPEPWLTRSWRPLLMLVLMAILLFVGLLPPMANVVAGQPMTFMPHWQSLPSGFWNFISVAMGGYIGARSLEKIARMVAAAVAPARKAGNTAPVSRPAA